MIIIFISRIKELRIKKGWSQEELSKRVNLSQMTISNLERNLRSTTLSTIEEISKALDCCPRMLFYYECSNFESCKKQEKVILNCQSTDKY